ncbi:hypothetical protein NIES4101_48100 [Calothrix sp. NIES-4101]|nr:hypothetical protein NIES4101_48100 [Calothrix sp. NIES-4101]
MEIYFYVLPDFGETILGVAEFPVCQNLQIKILQLLTGGI